MIACVLIPHFAAAVERLDAPSMGTAPLVIERSGKVLAVSEDAARAGIQPGMRTPAGRGRSAPKPALSSPTRTAIAAHSRRC